MKDEPVNNAAWVKFLAGLVAMFAAKYLPQLGITDVQALAMAAGIFAIVSKVATSITRSKVMPMTKIEAALKTEHPAAFAALKRPS